MTRLGNDKSPSADAGWQLQLRDAVREIGELERLLELPAGSLDRNVGAQRKFPLLVPHAFVARMRKGDPQDPLLRQVLPTTDEDAAVSGFGADPLGERALADRGLIGKYPGRVLLITTGACPVHCRYCFRREFPYSRQTAAREAWQPAVDAIREQRSVNEVILSGGDPLTLGNEQLRNLISQLEAIPAIETLRIHTRFPVVLPARIDDGLTGLLDSTRLNTVVVIHANHPAEIDDSVRAAAKRLKRSTNYLLNQSVLMRGINDSVDTLLELGAELLRAGVLPYYIHLLDRVSGSAQFEVPADRAVAIVTKMRQRAPGFLVPKLVRDQPGELSKTPVI